MRGVWGEEAQGDGEGAWEEPSRPHRGSGWAGPRYRQLPRSPPNNTRVRRQGAEHQYLGPPRECLRGVAPLLGAAPPGGQGRWWAPLGSLVFPSLRRLDGGLGAFIGPGDAFVCVSGRGPQYGPDCRRVCQLCGPISGQTFSIVSSLAQYRLAALSGQGRHLCRVAVAFQSRAPMSGSRSAAWSSYFSMSPSSVLSEPCWCVFLRPSAEISAGFPLCSSVLRPPCPPPRAATNGSRWHVGGHCPYCSNIVPSRLRRKKANAGLQRNSDIAKDKLSGSSHVTCERLP